MSSLDGSALVVHHRARARHSAVSAGVCPCSVHQRATELQQISPEGNGALGCSGQGRSPTSPTPSAWWVLANAYCKHEERPFETRIFIAAGQNTTTLRATCTTRLLPADGLPLTTRSRTPYEYRDRHPRKSGAWPCCQTSPATQASTPTRRPLRRHHAPWRTPQPRSPHLAHAPSPQLPHPLGTLFLTTGPL